MSSTAIHEALVRQMFAGFDAKETSILAGLVTDDVSLQLGNSPTSVGKPAFVVAVDAFLASVDRFRHEILGLWHDDEMVIAELKVHYVRLDGKELALPCCNVFKFHGEQISEYRSYMDINPVYA